MNFERVLDKLLNIIVHENTFRGVEGEAMMN